MKKKTEKLHFKVTKEIVNHLSKGLYRNFGRAIKELISNSYDAQATKVKIRLDLENSRIVVKDNGEGMNLKEEIEKYDIPKLESGN